MNVAIIIAGGVGSRTGNKIPKQFINVNDKPIIIYTLERFQKHKNIDVIEVVCLDGWHDILRAYAEQYGIAKLKYIISGGTSSQDFIKIGLENLKGKLNKDDIVVIHDGIRPMVDAEIISSCIDTCVEKGNGVSAFPVYEQIFETDDNETTDKYIPREKLRIVQDHHRHIDMAIFWMYTIMALRTISVFMVLHMQILLWQMLEKNYIFQKVQLRILR